MEDILTQLETAQTNGHISADTFTNTKSWLENDQVVEFHNDIKDLITREDWPALNDAFYTQIEFGTAGIRGRTGLGSARINSWTIGAAAQGLANYLNSLGESAKERGVVVGSDTRLTSPEFVTLVADVLTSNRLRVYLFDRPPQVGMFSYAVRLYKAQAGVYISASHNPPSDNGFKCYWEDGAQVLPPHDKAVTEAVKQVTSIVKGKKDESLITRIGEDFDTTYRTRILHESVSEDRGARIVYSPFHGTGQYGVLPILQEAGFEVITVDEQMKPDGNFPNVPGGTPNPENREANELTAKKVLETNADLGVSTDPDADRLGLVVRKGEGTAILSGNETATLVAYYICNQLKKQDKLPKNGFMVRTFVTTAVLDAMAEDFNLKMYHTPVGFKYIGEVISQHEDFGDEVFVFGGEESFGCLKGSYAHDKDASSVALIAGEMVSTLKKEGRTVWDLLQEIYHRYGYYHNDLVNIKFEGAEGFAKMQKLMASLRENPPATFGDWKVDRIIDRKTNEIRNVNGEAIEKIEGHTTNMLTFNLSADGKNTAIIRPSGTEPKVKIYLSLCNDKAKEEGVDLEAIMQETATQADSLKMILTDLANQLTQ